LLFALLSMVGFSEWVEFGDIGILLNDLVDLRLFDHGSSP